MGSMQKESKTDVVMKLVLVFFISLLSFSVGTFVGKKFSDNQYKLSKFEPNKQKENLKQEIEEEHAMDIDRSASEESHRDPSSVPPDATSIKPSSPINQNDIAKLAEEFVKDDGTLMQKSTQHQETEKKTSALPVYQETHTVVKSPITDPSVAAQNKLGIAPLDPADRIANNLPPEPIIIEPASDDRIPSSLPRELASSPLGKFTVQIASFPSETEAQKKASELKSKGYAAFYIKAKVKDTKGNTEKIWYRVSVGLFTTSKDADKLRKELVDRSHAGSAIVHRIAL